MLAVLPRWCRVLIVCGVLELVEKHFVKPCLSLVPTHRTSATTTRCVQQSVLLVYLQLYRFDCIILFVRVQLARLMQKTSLCSKLLFGFRQHVFDIASI